MPVYADTILKNGKIWLGASGGHAEALAIFAGRVLATGTTTEITTLAGPETKIIDLGGRFAMPGLNEAHLHLLPMGLTMEEVDARPAAAPTLEKLLANIAARAKELGPGKWVLARGYDQAKLDIGRHPTREELDRAAPENPVYLVRTCGHVSICNSMAFARAQVTAHTPSPAGGLIEVKDGQLTGFLAETGRDPVREVIPEPTDDELVAAIERGGRYLLEFGITSCMDAGVGMRAAFREIAAYHRAEREGRLPVRTYQTLMGDPGGRNIVPECRMAGLITGTGSDMLRIGPVKIFTDGSVGGRTAWMRGHYDGQPENFGLATLDDATLEKAVMEYHRAGYQMAIHAIGDAAIEQVLVAYEKALAAHPDPDRRHRIEHCGFPSRDQLERMKKAGIYPAPQPVFMHDFADLYASVLDKPRVAASYPFRTFYEMGLKPSASSDAPVCDANPFPSIYAMLTRTSWRGNVHGADETLTHEQALQSFTEFSAFGEKTENEKGRLVPGFLADIAVFSRDLTKASPEDILNDTRCELTILGGRIAFDRSGLAA